ncbi:Inorganic polyphosphate/ATP-NAD kinase predicted [Neofusicoccum parvum]|uniref:Inorganic polyphosphate/ATP-NAD kinase predicted n=1 Tax=Neofusicoccum parvum TaxID=310453 RepID=A0ACB5SPB2_9PEZI|nr:Inorganic polyphosphate/ATP-NAD kinase predicted [Neofusicoccum parvum]
MEAAHAAGDSALNRSDEELDRVPSDSETQNALEVVFDNEAVHRRKSSLAPGTAQRPRHLRKPTNCFVHSLIEPHRDAALQQQQQQQQQHQQPSSNNSGVSSPVPGGEEAAPAPSYEGLRSEKVADKNPDGSGNGDAVQSRLLTKRQISDMAFGIRELAKKLAHIRIKMNVRNVFILAKAHDETLIGNTREVAEWLLGQDANYKIYVEKTLEDNKIFDTAGLVGDNESYKHRLRFWTVELCQQRPQTWDIVLALGGDGTVLLRLRFEATVMRSQRHKNNEGSSRDLVEELIGEEAEDAHTHRPDGTHNILNEVVLDRGPNPTMSSIEIFGDDEHYTSVQADGICIATPTGSTAYNLAAGGSLCHPDNPVILLTAICAHTLSFRPIVLPDTIVLRAGVPYDARTSSWASFDGRERVELKPGDYVTVSASRFPFPSVLPLERRGKDWIDSISRTLNWNSRQRQKSFKEWEK